VIFWEKLRSELGRYAEGVHDVGAPLQAATLASQEQRLGPLPAALVELYRSFDGLRLFTDSLVIFRCQELERQEERIRLGEAWGAPLFIDSRGRVYESDDVGDRILCGSELVRFLDAVMAREKLVVDREGEFKDVFVDGGELDPKVRHQRARVGLKIDPDAAAWHLEAAELAFEAGQTEKAESELLRAVECDPQAGLAWLLLGGLKERAGHMREAAHGYRRSAECSSDAARRAERFAEAARVDATCRSEDAQKARAADPEAVTRWLSAAEERLQAGDADGALRLAEWAEAVEPGRGAALLQKARLKSRLKIL
jgi:tetratricopeptide (TPR) repeat protein